MAKKKEIKARGKAPKHEKRPKYKQAFAKIKEIVGEDFLIQDKDEIEKRSKTLLPFERRPLAYIYPGSKEEVSQIVKIADEHKLPLWPASRAKNWGYGSGTPAQDRTAILSLERLNKILEVNEEMAYCVIEPGVTFRQLHEYLEEKKLPLWIDCTDGPAQGSIVGNSLERGVGETNYGDHFGNICGMEVLLPDGSMIQTGGGPIDRFKSWNIHKWSIGPYIEGLFSQGNYGIVLKAGIWLMPKPKHFASVVFELKKEESLPQMIDALRRLQLNGALKSKIHIINDVVTFAVVSDSPRELLEGASYLIYERRQQLQKRFRISPWSFAAGLYGTKDQIKANMRLIRKELGHLGKLQFIGKHKLYLIKKMLSILKKRSGNKFWKSLLDFVSYEIVRKPFGLIENFPHVYDIEMGYPSDYFVKHGYYKYYGPKPADDDIDPARDECGLIWHGPLVPLKGSEVKSFLDLVRPYYEKYELDLSIALMVANERTVIALLSIFYDKQSPEETKRAKLLYFELGKVIQDAGYQAYRTSTIYMDRIFSNVPSYLSFLNKIKKAIDPNNIIAPGKYGIDAR